MKKEKAKKDPFWETVKKNKAIVKTWPEWKKRITISAHTAMTGEFILPKRRKAR